MDNYLIEFIKQRMRELDIEEYSLQPIRVKPGVSSTLINAQNEYYYLVAKTLPASMVITSDTNSWYESVDYPNFNFYGIQEFTGAIQITSGVLIDLEFIRVVPRTKIVPDQICLYLKEVELIENH